MHVILTGRLSASFPCLASLRQHTQACCEPVKITAKFQWFWILYIIISFFSYTRTAIQTTTVCMLYVIGY